MGGSIYIEQILHLLTLLPPHERPRVKIRLASPTHTPFAQRLAKHPTLRHRRDFSSTTTIPARFEKTKRLVAKHAPRLAALLRLHTEVLFPVFEATKPWENNLYWIPDFQHHHLPHLFSPEEIESKNRNIAAIARSRGTLLLSSHAALADFRRFYPEATVNTCVWRFTSTLKADPAQDPRQQLSSYRLPEKFVYVANQFWKHKDHTTLFAALELLRARGLSIPVVCTGHTQDPRDPGYFASLQSSLVLHDLQHHVTILNIIPREVQCALFRLAALIVQPSTFEGWSTVIEDAKVFGRPIIASNIPTHLEQLTGIPDACFFSVGNATSLAAVLADAWAGATPGPNPARETTAWRITTERKNEAAKEFMAALHAASRNFNPLHVKAP
jgi:glycosyltransferase involved in cell wall biosynthesis